jgi:PhnB protein
MSEIKNNSTTLIPYLSCRNAVEAVEFYKRALGAEAPCVLTMPDGKLMHAALNIDGASVYLTDECPDYGSVSPTALGGTPVTLHLQVPDCDASFQRAVDAGCTALMAPEDQFWGDRYSLVQCPYGHRWAFATTVRQVSMDEIKETVAGFAGAPA